MAPREREFEFKHEAFSGLEPAPEGLPDPDGPGSAGGAAQVAASTSAGAEQQPFVREGRKVGRNEPCPCGSGKKYKQCHGKVG